MNREAAVVFFAESGTDPAQENLLNEGNLHEWECGKKNKKKEKTPSVEILRDAAEQFPQFGPLFFLRSATSVVYELVTGSR